MILITKLNVLSRNLGLFHKKNMEIGRLIFIQELIYFSETKLSILNILKKINHIIRTNQLSDRIIISFTQTFSRPFLKEILLQKRTIVESKEFIEIYVE